MVSQIVSVTWQAVLFSAISTSLAQSITAWQKQSVAFDASAFITFIIIAIVTTPPNFLYQRFLEDTFPSQIPAVNSKEAQIKEVRKDASAKQRLSKSNTVAKFILDQSLGAAANTALFIFLLGLLQGKNLNQLTSDLRGNFWPMITAGWSFWPMITMLNLVLVPFDYRMLLGNVSGILWGVFINLRST